MTVLSMCSWNHLHRKILLCDVSVTQTNVIVDDKESYALTASPDNCRAKGDQSLDFVSPIDEVHIKLDSTRLAMAIRRTVVSSRLLW